MQHAHRVDDRPGGQVTSRATPAPAEREFAFSRKDFERVRSLIHRHAGISLGESKSNLVYSRLVRRLRALGLSSFEEYLARLEQDTAGERQAFVNSLTTNLTAFFRESHHFEILAQLLADRAGSGGPIAIWCAASSTGEEPYSIAMTALDVLGPATSRRVSILASDIDTQVLAHAERGVYEAAAVEKLDPARVRRHFLRGTDASATQYQVREPVRALVRFARVNLLDRTWPVRGPLDAIFCRNVMIYFDRPTQRRVLEGFAPLLATGGRLFMGHSESLGHARDLFTPAGSTTYWRAVSASGRL